MSKFTEKPESQANENSIIQKKIKLFRYSKANQAADGHRGVPAGLPVSHWQNRVNSC